MNLYVIFLLKTCFRDEILSMGVHDKTKNQFETKFTSGIELNMFQSICLEMWLISISHWSINVASAHISIGFCIFFPLFLISAYNFTNNNFELNSWYIWPSYRLFCYLCMFTQFGFGQCVRFSKTETCVILNQK